MDKLNKRLFVLKRQRAELDMQIKALEDRIGMAYQPDRRTEKVLYVLECEGGKYYVGHTADLKKRIKKHESGKGAWFTRENKPVGVEHQENIGSLTTSEATKLENDLTLRYIKRHGIENVRGGHFIQHDPKHFIHLVI